MRLRKTLYTVAVLVMGWSGVATAATAVGPLCNTNARVRSTTYYSCSGSSHTALDIGGVACGEPVYAPLSGSYSYKFYSGCVTNCYGYGACGNGSPNSYLVTGGDGWDFRIVHFIATADTFAKTCSGCRLGQLGGSKQVSGTSDDVLVHLENRQYGTRKSSWYISKGTTCGSSGYCGSVIGYPTL